MEIVSVIVALLIAASTILTAVFNARKGAEDTLQALVKQQGARITELENKLEERDRTIAERDARIDELERRVNVLSSELQKITHPKMKVGRMKKK